MDCVRFPYSQKSHLTAVHRRHIISDKRVSTVQSSLPVFSRWLVSSESHDGPLRSIRKIMNDKSREQNLLRSLHENMRSMNGVADGKIRSVPAGERCGEIRAGVVND